MNIKEKEGYTHEAYSDESSYHHQKYAAICLFSVESSFSNEINTKINQILTESNVKELKWIKINGAKGRFCANKVIDYLFKIYTHSKFRIDILIWDMKERKERYSEGDILILKKMYYHLFKNVLKRRWPKDAKWILFPDEQGAIDWEESKRILDHTASRTNIKKIGSKLLFELKEDFQVVKIKEVPSHKFPLCQIADLFGGMGAFSYNNQQISKSHPGQKTLTGQNVEFTNAQKEKLVVLNYFKNKCKAKNIKLVFSPGLRTANPNDKINFWYFKYKAEKRGNRTLNRF